MKPLLLKLKSYKPTKKQLLVTGLSLIVVSLIVLCLAVYQQGKLNQAHTAALAASKAQAKEKAQADYVQGLKDQLKTYQARDTALVNDRQLLCNATAKLTSFKATRIQAHCQ